MSDEIDPLQIAARISFLIGAGRAGYIEEAARRLGVSETALRISVEGPSPHPVLEVIVAVVRHYGIDSSWLVFGDYDPASKAEVGRMVTKYLTPTGSAAILRPRAEREG